jgi:plastocyanin
VRSALAAAAALIALALAAGGTAAAAPSATIVVADFRFAPSAATVARGTRVVFVWKGRAPHDAKAAGPARFASRIQTSGTFAATLARRGFYRVTCSLHPRMRLALTVR